MSRSFTEPAFSRTATYRVKQLTSSTQNTFPFQNCHSCFGWKNTMSSAQIGGLLLLPLRLPRPWAPPTDTSPSSRCRRGEGQGHLHTTLSALLTLKVVVSSSKFFSFLFRVVNRIQDSKSSGNCCNLVHQLLILFRNLKFCCFLFSLL